MEVLVTVHVPDDLQEHSPLQHLAQHWQNSNRPIVLGFQLAPLAFIKWYDLGYFPFVWELVGLYRDINNMTNCRDYVRLDELDDIGVNEVYSRSL